MLRFPSLVVSLVLLQALLVTANAAAQGPPSPGGFTATVGSTNTLTLRWTYDMTTYPDTVFGVQGTVNGVPFGVLPLADRALRSGNSFTAIFFPIPPGNYSLQLVALNFRGPSAPTAPVSVTNGSTPGPCAPPSEPVLNTPVVQGSTVTLTWVRTDSSTTGFDIEAIVQATGQTLNLPVDNITSRAFGNVPPGNFIVRIRAKNACGVSAYTAQQLVVVGVTLAGGALQATLTWNTTADIDLHMTEPNQVEVFYANRSGRSARLDRDDTDGFGPENIFVDSALATSGIYRISIVHFSGAAPTTATIAITLFGGTPQARSVLITRQTSGPNRSVALNVATVNLGTGEIIAVGGTSSALTAAPYDIEIKAPEPDPASVAPLALRPGGK